MRATVLIVGALVSLAYFLPNLIAFIAALLLPLVAPGDDQGVGSIRVALLVAKLVSTGCILLAAAYTIRWGATQNERYPLLTLGAAIASVTSIVSLASKFTSDSTLAWAFVWVGATGLGAFFIFWAIALGKRSGWAFEAKLLLALCVGNLLLRASVFIDSPFVDWGLLASDVTVLLIAIVVAHKEPSTTAN